MKTKINTLLLVLVCLFTACKKENPPPQENIFNPDAKLFVSIPYQEQKNNIKSFSDTVSEETARFLLNHGYKILTTCYQDVDRGKDKEPFYPILTLAAIEKPDIYYMFRDTVNIKYIFRGIDVVEFNSWDSAAVPYLGTLPASEDIVLVTIRDSTGDLIDLLDLTFEKIKNPRYDTIAYVPNEVMRAGKKQLNAALARKDYNECYRIFNDFYKFTPITGAEYMELVRQGKN